MGGIEGLVTLQVSRKESVKVVLHGQAEFEASHVVLLGSHTFEVSCVDLVQGNADLTAGLSLCGECCWTC